MRSDSKSQETTNNGAAITSKGDQRPGSLEAQVKQDIAETVCPMKERKGDHHEQERSGQWMIYQVPYLIRALRSKPRQETRDDDQGRHKKRAHHHAGRKGQPPKRFIGASHVQATR